MGHDTILLHAAPSPALNFSDCVDCGGPSNVAALMDHNEMIQNDDQAITTLWVYCESRHCLTLDEANPATVADLLPSQRP